jgi:uroporphyrinogen-III decarboxylase
VNDDLADTLDIQAHNAEVRHIWESYQARRPTRVPMILGINPRYLLLERGANALGLDFRTYSEDPDAMFSAQLAFQRWVRHNLMQDAEMGMPEAWTVYVDFQNYYEAAWFGCPIAYREGQVPDAIPIYAECPERVMDAGIPDPFGGIMGRALEYFERFKERAAQEQFCDRPISAAQPATGMGTDGPMTVACNLFGAAFVCETLAADPSRMERLLQFITDATVTRVEAWKRRFGVTFPHDGYGIADDSIALLSVRTYREHILPLHQRLFDRFGTANGRGIHLCGDATRHFRLIHEALGVESFDTGFPVDLGALRCELGDDVQLLGGPSAPFLAEASPDAVRAATRDVLSSGVMRGGRFILREGNNLAPGTPRENIAAMYETVRQFGRFKEDGTPCML